MQRKRTAQQVRSVDGGEHPGLQVLAREVAAELKLGDGRAEVDGRQQELDQLSGPAGASGGAGS